MNSKNTEDKFLSTYYKEYESKIMNKNLFNELIKIKNLLVNCSKANKKVIFAGNGASASIASHAALDFTKQAKIKSVTFHDPSLITAYANDFGYEDWLKSALSSYANSGDVLVLISVSGESPNIISAANYAKREGMKIITLTGRSQQNTLKNLGDINLWVNSDAYNIVECIHMIWITSVIDLVIGKSVYEVS